MINFRISKEYSNAYIKCQSRDLGNEIEISKCNLNFQTRTHNPSHLYGISYIFRINWFTKYQFVKYIIKFTIDGDPSKTLDFTLINLTIDCKTCLHKCEWINPTAVQKSGSLHSNTLIYPCSSDYLNYTYLYTTAVSTNAIDILSSPNPPPRQEFYRTRYISIVTFMVVPLMSLLIYMMLKRRQQSR
ncbi:hypothetical protein RF11_01045 [Thelohanellus kitauei]|uniref:Uncharacterized protein n=1 Tax=Thelohanellus kitauei TaxID=669202 RepID=A0A0C2IYU9_THEKT|nr:hypothetical protein RF11_01045 [Thelohanellus kitauei]